MEWNRMNRSGWISYRYDSVVLDPRVISWSLQLPFREKETKRTQGRVEHRGRRTPSQCRALDSCLGGSLLAVLRIVDIIVFIEFVVSVDHTSLYESVVWVYIVSSVCPTAEVQLLYSVRSTTCDIRWGGALSKARASGSMAGRCSY